MSAAAVRALNCPNCGGAIELRAAGYTVSLVCPHCGSTLDAADPDVRLIERADAAMRVPEIALGTRGTLDGVEWEAVGYVERRSEDGGWSEYLLFNPYQGYRFLVDDGERFSLGGLTDRTPEQKSANTVAFAGSDYHVQEEAYEARVVFVVGEFYWRVRVGETVEVQEYLRFGGGSLSAETSDGERTWTAMQRVDVGKIETAFGIAPRAATGLAAFSSSAATSPNLERLKQSWRVALYAIVALMLASMLGCSSHKVLLTQDIALDLDAPGRTVVLGPIEMTSPLSALTVRAETSGLDNAWVDLAYSLVDRRTPQSYDAYTAAEYYHGRDSDGDWTEGERNPAARFSSIPRGSYDLVVEAAAHSWSGGTSSSSSSAGNSGSGFTFNLSVNGTKYSYGGNPAAAAPSRLALTTRLTVRRGASFSGNFWLAVVLVLLWPAFLIWRLLRGAGSSGE